MHVIRCCHVICSKNDTGPKVRTVPKVIRQVCGVESHVAFASVISLFTVRLLLSFVSVLDLYCDQIGVVSAFLKSYFQGKTHVERPATFPDRNKRNLVCLKPKPLCGLKQVTRDWYARTQNFLTKDLQIERYLYELCLYTLRKKRAFFCDTVYGCELLPGSSSCAEILLVRNEFKRHFKMEALGLARELPCSQTTSKFPKCQFHLLFFKFGKLNLHETLFVLDSSSALVLTTEPWRQRPQLTHNFVRSMQLL